MSVVASRVVENRRSPLFARVVAWLIVPIYITGTGANIWLEGRLRPNEGNLWEDALLLVGFGAFVVVGALLVAQKPGNLVGWILLIALVLFYLQTLEAFSLKLREETDLNRLDDELVAVVKETLQPAHISLWLWDGG